MYFKYTCKYTYFKVCILRSTYLLTKCIYTSQIQQCFCPASHVCSYAQVPGSWRDVITDPATTTLFFDFYKSTGPPQSALAMQSVILLSSVRRSLFPKDADRAAFLQQLMDFLRDILRTQRGLQHGDNYHEFCRQVCASLRSLTAEATMPLV